MYVCVGALCVKPFERIRREAIVLLTTYVLLYHQVPEPPPQSSDFFSPLPMFPPALPTQFPRLPKVR